jgi:Rps23 Pro-64 3,4-dihydroxylase Tpa1-like proline 4-hydroxylase
MREDRRVDGGTAFLSGGPTEARHCLSNRPFELGSGVDIQALARSFATSRRIQISNFLASDAATELCGYVEQSDDWRHLFNSGSRYHEVSCNEWDALKDSERNKVLKVIAEAAAYDFQYQYDTIRVAEDPAQRRTSNTMLDRFAQFLSSKDVLRPLMEITGSDDLVFADCQATRYRPGDFLTPHTDELDGMDRKFAYVLSLAPFWLPRWGGLLHFVGADGGVEETFTPRFNTLSLFSVGQSHYVSQIATYAPVARMSLTGWLRTKAPG